MEKKRIRDEILEKRSKLDKKTINSYSNSISDKLFETSSYKNSTTIMCFISFSDEVNTHELIKNAIKHGKTIVVPITVSKTKELKVSELLDFSELEIGYYNILTPKAEFIRFVDPNTIDLVLVPGVAFARNGYRVGYGGGYYDRFLSKLDSQVKKIGLGFYLQVVDTVPVENFDIPIDAIITEKEIIYCSKKEI